jgi:serine/threonine-protein kinase
MADALEAAHEKSVIHRDLKPSNLKVTPDGRVKVLDFGLAKAFDNAPGDASLTYSPTLSLAATQQGVILGTAAYMSPEQAKGRPADRRADIFAFGSVLFEMLTGQQAFRGELASEIMASVINQEPDYARLPPSVPPRLDALLRRCLKKDPKQRWQAAGDLRLEIEEILQAPAASREIVTPAAGRRVWLPWAVALVGIAASASAAWYLKPSPAIPVTKFPVDLVGAPPILDAIAVSPDGRRIVYQAEGRFYLRDLGQMTSIQIPGTEGGFSPFFSPDGTRIAFTTPTQLKAVDVRGGLPVTLATLMAPVLQGVWHESGRLFFGQSGSFGLSSVPESGGEITPFASLGKSFDVDYPDALPGGEWILFTEQTSLNWNDASIVAQSIKTGERKVLLKGGFYARYVRTGHLVYARAGSLYAVRFDAKNLAIIGNPVLMVEHVLMLGFIAGQAQFAIAGNGTLIYRPGTFGQTDLALVNNAGDVRRLNLPSQTYANPQLSPNGSQIAVQSFDDTGNDRIWVQSLSANTQLRELAANARNPIWTRDGQRITFEGTRDGVRGVYWQRADGSSTPDLLFTSSEDKRWLPQSWSPDGRVLLVSLGAAPGGIATYTLGKDKEPQPLPHSDVSAGGGAFSPDGKWIAYHRATGVGPTTLAIHVQPFPPTGAEYRVSPDLRVVPSWRPGTNEIVYVAGLIGDELSLAATSVTTTGSFAVGKERLLPVKVSGQVLQRTFDVSRDGLVIVVPSQNNARPQINVVLNWFDELLKRVPVQ